MTVLRRGWVERLLILITIVGLGIDAYVHLHVASSYRLVRTSALSQADLFRLESVLAILAALWLLIRPSLFSAVFAFLVAAGGVAAVTFYYYADPGQLCRIPDMDEPVWYADKTWSFDGEAVAAVSALVLLVLHLGRTRRKAYR